MGLLVGHLFLNLGLAVEVTEVSLPANGDSTREDAAISDGDVSKAECQYSRPQLPRIHPADGDSADDAVPGLGNAISSQ